jgi:hypothetical protein
VNNDNAKNDGYLYRGQLGEITYERGICFFAKRPHESETTLNGWFVYQGPLSYFVHHGSYLNAARNDILIGIYDTFEQAEKVALLREKLKRQSEE